MSGPNYSLAEPLLMEFLLTEALLLELQLDKAG